MSIAQVTADAYHAAMPNSLDCAAMGQRIAAARTAAGLNQDDAAEVAAVHKQTWSKWERGIQPPDSASLYLICRALAVSADHLIGLPKARRK